MQTFSKIDYLKYLGFIVGCTGIGVILFSLILGLPSFFNVFLTVVGTQLALKYLGKKVIGIDYWMAKEKKL
jgi:hypothetical protein